MDSQSNGAPDTQGVQEPCYDSYLSTMVFRTSRPMLCDDPEQYQIENAAERSNEVVEVSREQASEETRQQMK